MSDKVNKPIEHLKSNLVQQLRLLEDYCTQYDAGRTEYVYPMSTALRVLLKDSQSCHALLGQLGLKDNMSFIDSAHHCKGGICCWEISDLSNATMIDGAVYAGLVAKRLSRKNNILVTKLMPLCQFSMAPDTQLKLFDSWYNDEVLNDGQRKMSRRNVIENIAEMEGGCHVDPDSTPEQATFQKPEALRVRLDNTFVEFEPAPVYVSLRQIAWEVLESLKMVGY
ncbi:MAG: hypothetical protein IJS82_06015 [Paludibacteraceae bacterium]|nr:hypothetical protein [Paludibacteraceae bacterium]